jgi:hypothetical protein
MSAGNSEFTAEFFDDSSRAWMMNKKRNGASMLYICSHAISTTRRCKNIATMNLTDSSRLCKLHINKELKSISKDGGKLA